MNIIGFCHTRQEHRHFFEQFLCPPSTRSRKRARGLPFYRQKREGGGSSFLRYHSRPSRRRDGDARNKVRRTSTSQGKKRKSSPIPTRADDSPSLPIPLFLSLTFFFSKATHGRGFFFPRPHRSIFPRPVSLNPSHEQSPPEFCLIAHEESGNPLANARPRASLWRRERTLPFSGYQRHEFAGG